MGYCSWKYIFSDVNWWKGRSHRGEGLFPASFVTSDLSPPTQSVTAVNGGNIKAKSVQFDANVDIKVVDRIVETKPELKIDEVCLIIIIIWLW
jgi:signal transducing adaptor molecule